MNDFWGWFGWGVVALLATVVAIRGTITFDVNEWLKERKKKKEENLRSLCPHAQMVQEGGEYGVRSTYISPMGTLAWQCQNCGDVTHDEAAVREINAYWAKDPVLRRKYVVPAEMPASAAGHCGDAG